MVSPTDPYHQGPGFPGVRYLEQPSDSRSTTAERRRSSAGARPSVPPIVRVTTLETDHYPSELSRPPNPFMPAESLDVYSPRPQAYDGQYSFIPEINPKDLVDRLQPSPGSQGSSPSAGSRRSSSSAGLGQQLHLTHIGTTSSPSRDKLSVQHHAPDYDPYPNETLCPVSPVSGASSPRGRAPGARWSPQLGPLPSHETSAPRSRSRPGSQGRMRTLSQGNHTPRSAGSNSKRRKSETAVESERTTASIFKARNLAISVVHELKDLEVIDSLQLQDRYSRFKATLEEGCRQTQPGTELNRWFIDNISRADERAEALRTVEAHSLTREDVLQALDAWRDLERRISTRHDTAPVNLETYFPTPGQNNQTSLAPKSRRPSLTAGRPSRSTSRRASLIDTSGEAIEPRQQGRKPYVEKMPPQC